MRQAGSPVALISRNCKWARPVAAAPKRPQGEENGRAVAERDGGGQRQQREGVEINEGGSTARNTADDVRAQMLGGKTLPAQQGKAAQGKRSGQIAPSGEFVGRKREMLRADFGDDAHQGKIQGRKQRPKHPAPSGGKKAGHDGVTEAKRRAL